MRKKSTTFPGKRSNKCSALNISDYLLHINKNEVVVFVEAQLFQNTHVFYIKLSNSGCFLSCIVLDFINCCKI